MIEDRIRAFVAGDAGLTEPLADDEPLAARGFLVSLRLIELVAFLEDELGVAVRPVDLVPAKLVTVASIAAMVRSRLARGS